MYVQNDFTFIARLHKNYVRGGGDGVESYYLWYIFMIFFLNFYNYTFNFHRSANVCLSKILAFKKWFFFYSVKNK